MSNFLEDIIVQIIPGAPTVSRVGFGIPLVIGTTGQRAVLITGSGPSELVAKSVIRNATIALVIQAGAVYAYAFAGGVVTIDIPPGALVRDLVADFNANAPGTVTAVMSIESGTTGSGAVGVIASTPLTFTKFKQLVQADQLKHLYDTDDTEFKMVSNMFGQRPTPVAIYLLDVFSDLADIGAAIAANDTGVWYAAVTNSLDEAQIQSMIDYIENKQRMLFAVSSDKDVLTRIKSRRISWVIHDKPNDHPEASWLARNLPATPGSITWKWANSLVGQEFNAVVSVDDLLFIRNNNGQSYVRANGVSLMDEGRTNDPAGLTYIDSVRSQDYIDLNMTADIQQAFIDADNAGQKIPYTDSGFDIIGGKVESRLNLSGKAGIIAAVETAQEAEDSTDGTFVFKVNVPTRAQIKADDPGQIAARNLPGITFSYREAGALHEVKTITGRVIF